MTFGGTVFLRVQCPHCQSWLIATWPSEEFPDTEYFSSCISCDFSWFHEKQVSE